MRLFKHRLDQVERIGGSRVASHDDDLGPGFPARGRLLDSIGEIVVVQQEERVFQGEFPQVFAVAFGVIVAVGHIGLVGQIDEMLACKIQDAVAAFQPGDIVEVVEAEQFLEYGQSAGSRIENPDGKTAHLVGVFIEFDIEIGGCVIERLVDDSHIVDRHFYLAATCRKKQQEQQGGDESGERKPVQHFFAFRRQIY